MKKIKYFIIAAAALISGSAMAQKVVCPDVTFDQDGKANLVFSIESEEPSTLCEFFLTMPEGISIEDMKEVTCFRSHTLYLLWTEQQVTSTF